MKTLTIPILSLAVIFACDLGDSVADPVFGTEYGLVQRNQYPLFTGDSLFIMVGYSGCSGNHLFLFRHRIVDGAKAEVWLFKYDRDEMCLAYFEEIKPVGLPQEVVASQSITLLGPNGKKITLR